MKLILLFILSLSVVSTNNGQQILFSEDFENYNNGQNIGEQFPFIKCWILGSYSGIINKGANFELENFEDNGVSWINIATVPSNQNYYVWNVLVIDRIRFS